MKILWVCNGKLEKNIFHTASWIEGMIEEFSNKAEIQLGIIFSTIDNVKYEKNIINSISYYKYNKKIADITKYEKATEVYIEQALRDFKPDVIHVFGTEYPECLAVVNTCEKMNILDKVTISIQGLCSVYSKHYFANLPYGIINQFTIRDFIKQDNIKQQRNRFIKRGAFEIEAIKKVKHIIGRTTWDKACTYQINSNAKYYIENETLRESFYKNEWKIEKCNKYSIFTSQAYYPIKGIHYLIEAMPEVIKCHPKTHLYIAGSEFKTDFWHINSYGKYVMKLIKKYNLQSHITFTGYLNENEMCDRLLKSNVFVCPSSIENSPNSLGEAMILGVPTITADIGGVKDMFNHNEDGFIYQSDAPYMLACHICEIFKNNIIALKFSNNARSHAKKTHDKEKNIRDLLNIYKNIKGD